MIMSGLNLFGTLPDHVRAVLVSLKAQFEAGAARCPALSSWWTQIATDARGQLDPMLISLRSKHYSWIGGEGFTARLLRSERGHDRIGLQRSRRSNPRTHWWVRGYSGSCSDLIPERDFVPLAEAAGRVLIEAPIPIPVPEDVRPFEQAAEKAHTGNVAAFFPCGPEEHAGRWVYALHWLAWARPEGSLVRADREAWAGRSFFPYDAGEREKLLEAMRRDWPGPDAEALASITTPPAIFRSDLSGLFLASAWAIDWFLGHQTTITVDRKLSLVTIGNIAHQVEPEGAAFFDVLLQEALSGTGKRLSLKNIASRDSTLAAYADHLDRVRDALPDAVRARICISKKAPRGHWIQRGNLG
jgi:hypothetical protein